MAMDWHSWLSKTNLDPILVYEYGLIFVQNELQKEDIAYFNHEFLQSLGILVAKHRLEIVKLAKKEAGPHAKRFSRLVLAMNKTRNLLTKNIGKLSFSKSTLSTTLPPSELSPYRNHWSGALRRIHGSKENDKRDQKTVVTNRSRHTMWSGPLDKRMVMANRRNNVSGPLDLKMHQLMYPNLSPIVVRQSDVQVKDKMGLFCRSPTISGPIERLGLSPNANYYGREMGRDDDGVQSLWSLMFQDMKPT